MSGVCCPRRHAVDATAAEADCACDGLAAVRAELALRHRPEVDHDAAGLLSPQARRADDPQVGVHVAAHLERCPRLQGARYAGSWALPWAPDPAEGALALVPVDAVWIWPDGTHEARCYAVGAEHDLRAANVAFLLRGYPGVAASRAVVERLTPPRATVVAATPRRPERVPASIDPDPGPHCATCPYRAACPDAAAPR